MFRSRQSPGRFLATILFTDIVGSTDLAAKLGDRGWRRIVAAHHATVRRELRRFGGQEVDTAGDGFLATFGQPAQAIRAADAIVSEVAKLGVAIRAGLHTGEAEAIGGGKIGGIAVHIASRIMSAAGSGEVLISGTMRDLVSGSGLEFEDRGSQTLKGVPGEWRLWALSRPEVALDEAAIGAIVRVPEPRVGRVGLRTTAIVGLVAVLIGVAALLSVAGVTLLGRPSATPVASARASPPPPFALGANTVVVLEQASGQIRDVRAAQGGPASIAANGGAIWVGAVEVGVVLRMAAAGHSVVQTLGRVGRPSAIALGNGIVWVADAFGNRLVLLDESSGDQRATFGGVHLRRIAYGFNALWGTDDIGDRLVRFDGQTGNKTTEIPLGADSYPTGLAIGSDAIWVAKVRPAVLAKIDPTSGRVVADGIALRGRPDGIAATARDVWVTSRDADLLMRIDPTTNAVSTTVPVCTGPSGLAATDAGVWVACAGSGQVWHVARDGEVQAKVPVGGRPAAMAISGRDVWVAVATQ